MGNFEKLSVLVIVVIIVMILVVAIYTWTDNPDQSATTGATMTGSTMTGGTANEFVRGGKEPSGLPGPISETPQEQPWGPLFPPDKSEVDKPAPKPQPEKPQPEKPEPKQDKPTPADSGEPWMYTVEGGDTLSEIAMVQLGSMRRQPEIIRLNPGLDPGRLRVGQQLKMPPKGTVGPGPDVVHNEGPGSAGGARPKPGEFYVTRPGDTLERVSKDAYGTIEYWPEIWSRNLSTLNAPRDIVAGMKLFIPKVK